MTPIVQSVNNSQNYKTPGRGPCSRIQRPQIKLGEQSYLYKIKAYLTESNYIRKARVKLLFIFSNCITTYTPINRILEDIGTVTLKSVIVCYIVLYWWLFGKGRFFLMKQGYYVWKTIYTIKIDIMLTVQSTEERHLLSNL